MGNDALPKETAENEARFQQFHSKAAPRACSVLCWGGRERQAEEDSVSSRSDQGAVGKPPVGEVVDYMRNLSSRRPDEQQVNAFLSFSTDDRRSASVFDQRMSATFSNLELLGQPLTSTYDKDWQRRCNEKLQDCAFLICLIGEKTIHSAAVAWEIGRAIELTKPVLPVVLHSCSECLMPILHQNLPFSYSRFSFLTNSNLYLRVSELTK